MSQVNLPANRALPQSLPTQGTQQTQAVQAPAPTAPTGPLQPAPRSNPAAFAKTQAPQPSLLDPAPLEARLDQTPAIVIQINASRVPKPGGMPVPIQSLSQCSDQQLIDGLMSGRHGGGGPRFGDALRNAAAIRASGVLEDCRELAARKIEVPASELNRSVADDAVLVMRDFAKMTPEQIHALKEKAYHHPDVEPDRKAAIAKGYYGSDQHKAYGALVEATTGGIISAEEAMAMNPCGGIPGDGPKEVPLISKLDVVQRHAMRHDVLGFLVTRFEVGPGYGSKTTIFGKEKHEPLAGQILGLAREAFGEASVLPTGEHVAKPGRFKGGNA